MRNDRGEMSIPTILIGIILIVFAGICIFMLTGENGIFVPVRYEQNNTTMNENQTENTNKVEEQPENAESTNKPENTTQETENNTVTNNNVLTVPMQ